MGGHWNKRGGSYKEIDTEGTGGETEKLPPTMSALYCRETLLQLERDKDEPSGRRKRTKPYGVTLHGGKAAIGEPDLPQGVCANCGTELTHWESFRACHECGGQTKAPSEQQILEACRRARAG